MHNVTPDDVFGPKGVFGPDGPFGPNGPGPHVPPKGSGGVGDKGRYWPHGKPDDHFSGDKYPYGKGSKYPPSWGNIDISPIDGILDGVPKDVDIDWPKGWKRM